MDAALKQRVREVAFAAGFVRAGVARAGELGDEVTRLRAWLRAGYHGSMSYLQETADVRCDPTHREMLSSARSVIVLATAYASDVPTLVAAPGRIARYAQGRDYHALLYDRARPIKRLLRAHGAAARACVDTMPVLERAWAARAGIGFIGKNACLIVPGLGSHVLLSVIVTSAELPPDEPLPERCGSCRLCLDACPTRAFASERVLDARRCISYLTIEHEGEIDPGLREGLGDWLFGCDVCQDVCPFNKARGGAAVADAALGARERWHELGAEDFLRMDAGQFDAYSRQTPLRRPGRDGMARNAALLLGNAGDNRHLPVLQRAATSDPSPSVRQAAAWACTRLQQRAGSTPPR